MNGQDAAVFVALQASKYIIIALGVKIEGFSPTKCPVCIITQQTRWQMLRILC